MIQKRFLKNPIVFGVLFLVACMIPVVIGKAAEPVSIEREDPEDNGTKETIDISDADIQDVAQNEGKNKENAVGEAVLANNTIGNDFLSSAKLSREQIRAKIKEEFREIIENINISEEQKQDTVNNMISLTETSEMENADETLLSAEGFQDCVVSIVEGNVDVVVDAEGLAEQEIAQIQDIVKRKTGISGEKMVITPVAIKEGK